MANQFVTLPAPAGNGSGVAVDVSTFGGLKTVTNAGNGFTFEPTVTIEFSNQLIPTNFAPLWTFGASGERTIVVAARWMRATISNYKGGSAPVINVGGTDDGSQFAELIAPAGSGVGVGVDVSGLDGFKTIDVAQAFRGALNIEISEDGGATYSTIATFYGPGHKSQVFAADFMRVRRGGVPANSPGLPIINIGATDESAGAPGVKVEDEGVPIGPNQFGTLNFVGAGVTATDGGGGVAVITIPGGSAAKQVFNYICIGNEGGTFTIDAAKGFAARASALYAVQFTLKKPTLSALKVTGIVDGSLTTTQFQVVLSSEVEAGDTLQFTVEDLT